MVSGKNNQEKKTEQLNSSSESKASTKLPSRRTNKSKKTSIGSITPNALMQKLKRNWKQVLALSTGTVALIAIVVSGSLGQYYKNKTLPNVVIAGQDSGTKTRQELKEILSERQKQLNISFKVGEKTLEPKDQEVGFKFDIDKTIDEAFSAKRKDGFSTRVSFWKEWDVPAKVEVNDNLLNEYIQTNTPELQKAPQDARLEFDAASSKFVISKQADGESPDVEKAKAVILSSTNDLASKQVAIAVTRQGPKITEQKLAPLLDSANDLVSRSVVLQGAGRTFRATPADIASWMTPTPQEDGSMKLVIDPGKVQSYVEKIGKKISKSPQDKKVIRDDAAGTEVVLQEGSDGTELAGKQELTKSITAALKSQKDVSQELQVQTAAHTTVNMSSYDKWIEIDLSEQRTTAYEKATPVQNYLVATGTKGHETPVGEFAIWHKTKSQTMKGGSKADGSFYSIDNVEWVSYFYEDYALHGAWWRKQFGFPASHGCVNMTNADAQWLYEWAPMGTKVIVHA